MPMGVDIYPPFSGLWCGVSKTAPELSVDYPFTITKRKNYFRKNRRIWKFLPIPLLYFKCFFKKFTLRRWLKNPCLAQPAGIYFFHSEKKAAKHSEI